MNNMVWYRKTYQQVVYGDASVWLAQDRSAKSLEMSLKREQERLKVAAEAAEKKLYKPEVWA